MKDNNDNMKTFIFISLLINQIIIAVIFLYFMVTIIPKSNNIINSAFSDVSQPCIDAGTSGKGWKRQINGSISVCDLSANSTPAILNNLLDGKPKIDMPDNIKKHTPILIIVGITISIIIIFAPYFSFTFEQILKFIISIVIWIKFYFIEKTAIKKANYEKVPQETLELIHQQFMKESKEAQEKIFNSIINFIPNLLKSLSNNKETQQGGGNRLQRGGDGIKNFLSFAGTVAEKLTGGKGDCGSILRYIIGFTQIIFLVIFSELINGNVANITTVLITIFISTLIVSSILGTIIPGQYNGLLIKVLAAGLLIIYLIITIFFFNNISSITQIISYVCLILSIGLFIYSATDPTDFTNIFKSSPEKIANMLKPKTDNSGANDDDVSLGCLVYNYFSGLVDSLGFNITKLLLIILSIIFLPNYNNSPSEIIKSVYNNSFGPMQVFYIIVVIFMMIYIFLPIVSLCKHLATNEWKLDQFAFYGMATKVLELQRCRQNINKEPCSK